MATTTPYLNLTVTPEATNKSFKTWRLEMDNDSNSNMTKIDDAFKKMHSGTTSYPDSPFNFPVLLFIIKYSSSSKSSFIK